MTSIRQSTHQYETWLQEQLKGDLDKSAITKKHNKMGESAFAFLRATYWRWAETILEVCPDLASAPAVVAVGDIHLENYGTWRDADGRLVWGVNDFDEAAEMPFALDLVRLTTSALLGRGKRPIADEVVAAAVLDGYRRGLQAPAPMVLDRDWQWLRELVMVSEKDRARFWKKLSAARSRPAPQIYVRAIEASMPEQGMTIKTASRSAATGSLGRPRWVGIADWRGAPVVREAKAIVRPAWSLAHSTADSRIHANEIAKGRFRAFDPWLRLDGSIVVRRLSPNNRKVEIDDGINAFSPAILEAMGADLAGVHLGSVDRRIPIKRDLDKRKKGWLAESSRRAADAVVTDYKSWKAG
jgi:hypothetical protein